MSTRVLTTYQAIEAIKSGKKPHFIGINRKQACAGETIEFYVGAYRKDNLEWSGKLKAVEELRVELYWYPKTGYKVKASIVGKHKTFTVELSLLEVIAKNEGYTTVAEFFQVLLNGKSKCVAYVQIMHWTSLLYNAAEAALMIPNQMALPLGDPGQTQTA